MSLPEIMLTDNTSGYTVCTSHRIEDESVIEYFDGTFVAFCVRCAQRVEMDRIPGGTILQRSKSLLHVIKSNRVDQVHEIELSVLKALLQEEIDALKATSSILIDVEEILCPQ